MELAIAAALIVFAAWGRLVTSRSQTARRIGVWTARFTIGVVIAAVVVATSSQRAGIPDYFNR